MAISYSSVDTRQTIEGKRLVNQWLKGVIESENKKLDTITIVLCTDDYILKVNREFLQHDYFTDIITFDDSQGERLSGDLLISIDTVRSNAAEYGVSYRTELMRVVVHGVLHLCGYKDKSDSEAKQMREKENFYLARLENIL